MANVNIEESWKEVLAEEFNKPYFEEIVSFIKDEKLKGKQEKLDVAKPKGKLTAADFKKLRDMKEVTFGDTEDYEVEHYGDYKT